LRKLEHQLRRKRPIGVEITEDFRKGTAAR
jgi:hypothetical protein